jgi:hypothetical protein
LYPGKDVEYRVFAQHCIRENTGNVAKGKLTGHAPVATPDVVENVNQIGQLNPHISVSLLSQQIPRSGLTMNFFPSKINFFHF